MLVLKLYLIKLTLFNTFTLKSINISCNVRVYMILKNIFHFYKTL